MICKHIRRPSAGPRFGAWLMRCDCGWVGTSSQFEGTRPRGRGEIDADLEAAFVAHVPESERRAYLLVDASVPCAEVLPEGIPAAQLLDWWEEDDVRYARVELVGGEIIELPVGEVRTADHRVFRLGE